MPDVSVTTAQNERASAWNRDVRELVGEPLRPESLGSVLIAIPGSSGDIVLTTTILRWIKGRNPACRVSFAVKRSNLPLLAMCPGVDEALDIPCFEAAPGRTKREQYLAHYAGRADAVVYPVTTFEDMPDLLARHDFLEAMWLMAGVPDGPPPGPHRLWLNPPDGPPTADRALRRCLSAPRLAAQAARQPAQVFRRIASRRTVRQVGWKDGLGLLRHAAHAASVAAPGSPEDAARRFVILGSDAHALRVDSERLFPDVVALLRAQGRVVLHNVLDPIRALPGTVPLVCSYAEFLALRHTGVPFVGWRSGLCDLAAASPAPMAVIYPRTLATCTPLMHLTARTPLELFGFAAMGVAADCADIVCDRAGGIDPDALAAALDRPSPTAP